MERNERTKKLEEGIKDLSPEAIAEIAKQTKASAQRCLSDALAMSDVDEHATGILLNVAAEKEEDYQFYRKTLKVKGVLALIED